MLFRSQLGILVLGPTEALPDLQRLPGLSLAELGWSFATRLLVGSLLMGLLMAPPSGWLCWWWLQRRRQDPARPGNTIRSM